MDATMDATMDAKDWAKHVNRTVGLNVGRYRSEIGLSGQALADRCTELGYPITKMTISRIERGTKESITLPEIFVIGSALGVPPALLCVNLDTDFYLTPNQMRHGFLALDLLAKANSTDRDAGSFAGLPCAGSFAGLPYAAPFTAILACQFADAHTQHLSNYCIAHKAIEELKEQYKTVNRALHVLRVGSGSSISKIHRKKDEGDGSLDWIFTRLMRIEGCINFEITFMSDLGLFMRRLSPDGVPGYAMDEIAGTLHQLVESNGIDIDEWALGVVRLIEQPSDV